MLTQSSSSSPLPILGEGEATPFSRLQVRAKFFYSGTTKVTLRGVTYGPFRPTGPDGSFLPEPKKVAADFSHMRALGLNTLRLYHQPPDWFLDLAAEHRLRLLVTLPWHKRVLFLNDRAALATIRRQVTAAARASAGHPALLGFFIDNEIPADLVRWYGARRIEHFLNSLVDLIKAQDAAALTAYANFPPTEYLLPDALDFYAYNVYLQRSGELARYLARLQNLAGDKPLVLSEFGLDTLRHGEETQAQLLADQVTTAERAGLGGWFIFSWTDEWFTDGYEVTDWAFGLVTRDGRLKKSYATLQPLLAPPPLKEEARPFVSVIVCSYNGARTLRDCLNSLRRLRYPRYEVILVDDGSTDTTRYVTASFPEVRTILQPNLGLSIARNVGFAAAQGEIIAFTDSDCMVEEDWLHFLVQTLQSGSFACVGGPNISPPAVNWIQATVSAAPGSPSHVLLSDTVAEHVPGCNMAFPRWALEELGGFDPVFRIAGDDVDLCWRLIQRGYQIGFSPAALVWHYRRFTLRTYFSQQQGYGEAEALLRFKYLNFFSATGSARWHGQVYSSVRMHTLFSRPVIYHGLFGSGLFQCLYQAPASPLAALLSSLEWLAVTLFIFILSLALPPLRLLPLVMFSLTLGVALLYTTQARMEPRFNTLRARLLLFYLTLVQPWRRAWARVFTWLRGRTTPPAVSSLRETEDQLLLTLQGTTHLAFWSESGEDRLDLLRTLVSLLKKEGWKFSIDNGWSDWDLLVFASRWWTLHLRTMTEIYPQNRRLTRAGNFLRPSRFSWLVGGSLATLTLVLLSHPAGGIPLLFVDGLLLLAWISHGLRLRRRFSARVIDAASQAELLPLPEKGELR